MEVGHCRATRGKKPPRAFAKSGTGTLNDLTWLEEAGAGVAVIGRTGSAPCVPTGHRIPAQGNALGTVTVFPGVLKERRIFVNRGRLPNPGRCGVPSERRIGGPRLPRVAPWAGMRRPFRAEAGTPPLLVSRTNRLWSSHQKFVSGVTQMSASSLFCQPESVMIDFAKALRSPPFQEQRG
jgi:hypothetical protein